MSEPGYPRPCSSYECSDGKKFESIQEANDYQLRLDSMDPRAQRVLDRIEQEMAEIMSSLKGKRGESGISFIGDASRIDAYSWARKIIKEEFTKED